MQIELNTQEWPLMYYVVTDGEATIRLALDQYPATQADEHALRQRLAEARAAA